MVVQSICFCVAIQIQWQLLEYDTRILQQTHCESVIQLFHIIHFSILSFNDTDADSFQLLSIWADENIRQHVRKAHKSTSFLFCDLHSCTTSSSSINSRNVTFCAQCIPVLACDMSAKHRYYNCSLCMWPMVRITDLLELTATMLGSANLGP